MPDVLLQTLSRSEIEWIRATGEPIKLRENAALPADLEALYILLDGALSVHLVQPNAASELPASQEFVQLSSGDLAGAVPFLDFLPAGIVRANARSQLLKLSRSAVLEKLEQDVSFAAHFYHACALMLARRLLGLSQRLGCHPAMLTQMQLKEAAMVFAELQDSDLDWLIAVGTVRSLPAQTVLLTSGLPIDEVHILLDGAAALSLPAKPRPLVAQALSPELGDLGPEPATEFARLSRGDLIGEMVFVEAHSLAVAASTLRSAQVLSIPRWRLAAKLLHDAGFAARFYRVLAVMLANKQQAIVQRLGYDAGAAELGNQFLTRVALAEARFEWMLKRIQAQGGSEIRW